MVEQIDEIFKKIEINASEGRKTKEGYMKDAAIANIKYLLGEIEKAGGK